MFKRPDTPGKPGRSPLKVTSLAQFEAKEPRRESQAEKQVPSKKNVKITERGISRAIEPYSSKEQPRKPDNAKPAPKAMTSKRINNIVQYYLSQREACSGMVRQMLHRRAYQWFATLSDAEQHQAQEQFSADVEECISTMTSQGLINDTRYAEMRAYSWRSQGKGTYKIKLDLLKKEIDEETADAAIRKADEELIDASLMEDEVFEREGEYAAADRLAQKRKIGSYRRSKNPSDHNEAAKLWKREAGVLARAGYGLDIIRQVLDREPENDNDDDIL